MPRVQPTHLSTTARRRGQRGRGQRGGDARGAQVPISEIRGNPQQETQSLAEAISCTHPTPSPQCGPSELAHGVLRAGRGRLAEVLDTEQQGSSAGLRPRLGGPGSTASHGRVPGGQRPDGAIKVTHWPPGSRRGLLPLRRRDPWLPPPRGGWGEASCFPPKSDSPTAASLPCTHTWALPPLTLPAHPHLGTEVSPAGHPSRDSSLRSIREPHRFTPLARPRLPCHLPLPTALPAGPSASLTHSAAPWSWKSTDHGAVSGHPLGQGARPGETPQGASTSISPVNPTSRP